MWDVKLNEDEKLILSSYSKLIDYILKNFSKVNIEDVRNAVRDTNLSDFHMYEFIRRECYSLMAMRQIGFDKKTIKDTKGKIEKAVAKYIENPENKKYRENVYTDICELHLLLTNPSIYEKYGGRNLIARLE